MKAFIFVQEDITKRQFDSINNSPSSQLKEDNVPEIPGMNLLF